MRSHTLSVSDTKTESDAVFAVCCCSECLCGALMVWSLFAISSRLTQKWRSETQPCVTLFELVCLVLSFDFILYYYLQSHDQPLHALPSENMPELSMTLHSQRPLSLRNADLSVTLPNDVMTLIQRSLSGSNWNSQERKEAALEVKKS